MQSDCLKNLSKVWEALLWSKLLHFYFIDGKVCGNHLPLAIDTFKYTYKLEIFIDFVFALLCGNMHISDSDDGVIKRADVDGKQIVLCEA